MSASPTPRPTPTGTTHRDYLPIAQQMLQQAVRAAREEAERERAAHSQWQWDNRHLCTCPDGFACEYCLKPLRSEF